MLSGTMSVIEFGYANFGGGKLYLLAIMGSWNCLCRLVFSPLQLSSSKTKTKKEKEKKKKGVLDACGAPSLNCL